MFSDFDRASQDWHHEVDAEAARLVEEGVPPWDAAVQARQIVSRRRHRKAIKVITDPSDILAKIRKPR